MVHRHVPPAVARKPLAVLARDAEIRLYHGHRGDAPEAYDETRVDERDLPFKPFGAGVLLRGLRVAVARRAAFDDVGNIDLRAIKLYRRSTRCWLSIILTGH